MHKLVCLNIKNTIIITGRDRFRSYGIKADVCVHHPMKELTTEAAYD
jgi:hypothetical protein